MSRSSSWTLLRRPAIVAAVILACGTSTAELVDKSKPAGKTKPTSVQSMARIEDDTPRSVLKCWQEGRLVFESSNVGVGVGETIAGTPVTFKGPNGRNLQLLDLRQGLCILERTNG